jgi:putative two-component system response regulator
VRGYGVSIAYSASSALEDLRNVTFDLIIARLGMPDMEARQLIQEIKNVDPDAVIITILEEMDSETLSSCAGLGVYEFLSKPINTERLLFLVNKGMELHKILFSNRKLVQSIEEQKEALRRQNLLLNKRIEGLTKSSTRLYENLHATYMRTIKALAQTIDARDHYTHSHSENVSKYAVRIAEAMQLSSHEVEMIRQACELHDIGKIGIHDKILSKETMLTPEEREEINLHPLKGAQILEPLDFLEGVIELVNQHHEHYDGSGYPFGHKKDEIPLGARIIHVADAYDAMTSARAYRKIPFDKNQAIAEIKKNSGIQFDPKVVNAFFKVVEEF